MVAMLLQVIAPGEDKKYYLSGSKVICGAILMVAMLLQVLLQVIAPGEDKNLSGSKVICGAILMVVMLLQVIAPSEDKNLSGSKLICGAVLMMVTLLLVLAPGEDKNLSGSKLICGAVQVVAMLLQVIAPGEDKKELPVHMFLVTGPGFFSGHEQSPSLKSQFSSSESEQSQITLLMSINGKLSHILDHISELAKSVSKKENSAVEFAQESHNEEDWFNGVNLTLIPKRNIYTYGLSLLDIFFSKKELRESLLFPSMKSPKPSLCPEKGASYMAMKGLAALDAVSGLDQFGARGGPSSIIYVMYDELAQCNGEYGCKRFLRDGYQTVKEDPHRQHYEYSELKVFENIECEWPLFVIYLAINGVLDVERRWRELYLVPEDKVNGKVASTIQEPPQLPQKRRNINRIGEPKGHVYQFICPQWKRVYILPVALMMVWGVSIRCTILMSTFMYMRSGTHLVQFLDHEAFYLHVCLDNSLLVDLIRTDIAYLKTNWKLVGRPIIVLPILSVCNLHVSDFIATSCITKLDFLDTKVASTIFEIPQMELAHPNRAQAQAGREACACKETVDKCRESSRGSCSPSKRPQLGGECPSNYIRKM
eukprot:Em0001g1695a